MKKVLAILSALALFAGTLPMAMASDVVTEPGNVNTLILEETGEALVNDSTEYVTNYGTTEVTGEAATATGTAYHGGSAYTFPGANSQSTYVTYYPVLNEGQYRVYYYRPSDAYQSGLTVSGSNMTSKNFGYVPGTAPTAQFVEVGVLTATGVHGEDYVKITDYTESGVHAGYEQNCDAVKFVKVGIAPEIDLPETVGDVNQLILEENGQTKLNDEEAYRADYGATAVVGTIKNTVTGNSAYSNGNAYTFAANNNQSNYVMYYPVLNAGEYDVYLYTVNATYQPGLTALGSDGTSISTPKSRTAANGFLKLGTYTFTGEYGEDYVKVSENLDDMSNVGSNWTQHCDAIKFVKKDKAPLASPAVVETLILEEDGYALVNDSAEYVSNYGSTTVIGNATLYSSETRTHGGTAYRFPGANSQSKYVTYYPVLSAGKYQVYYYQVANAYQTGLTVSGSNMTGKNIGLVGGTAPTAQFVEVGVLTATGVYGEDYIKITDLTQSGVGSGYGQYCDAVKFVKVDERAASFNLNTADGTDSIGKYTWTVTKGASVDTASDGFKGKGWQILRPTLENDEETGESSAIKIAAPSDLYGMTDVTINLWVRNDAVAWNQNIIEVYQHDKEFAWANVRLENSKLYAYMRASQDTDAVGESVAGASVDAGQGEWHMVTLVIDNNTSTWSSGDPNGAWIIEAYYDGVSVGRRSVDNANGKWTNKFTADTMIYIGARKDGRDRFNGAIDEIDIYNLALTDDEVSAIFAKESSAVTSAEDNGISMENANTIAADDKIVISAAGVPAYNQDFEASATVNGEFDNEVVYVSNIADGLYVSNVTAADDKITVSFAGETAEDVAGTNYMFAAVQAYGDYTANSGYHVLSIKSAYDFAVASSGITDSVYTASIRNNYYDTEKTFDAVVAVYGSGGVMKDVYLKTGIDVPDTGSYVPVTTDALDYAEGDTVKLFVIDSIGNLTPLNVYK